MQQRNGKTCIQGSGSGETVCSLAGNGDRSNLKRSSMQNTHASGRKYLHLSLPKHLPPHHHSDSVSEKNQPEDEKEEKAPPKTAEESQEILFGKEALKQALEQEIIEYPIEKLKRACGNKRYRELLDYLHAGEQPQIQEGTIITVKVPWEDTAVKLLSPLEFSTCTCKSRELCPHKAQAILLFQLHRKAVTLEQLKRLTESNEEWNHQELARSAASIKEGIRLHLMTGLSRLSPEAAESMERLAVISHGAGLAAFETSLRKIASEYRLYFERSQAFRTEGLLEQLLTLYQMAESLEHTKDPEKLRALAGSFRDTYRPVSRLHLTAMGSRSFHSKTGYEGEIYYFLEPEKGSFYTWTDARPVFYEGVRRRPLGGGEQAQAPWGLNCSREQMMDLEFYLTHAKAAAGGKLSVSQETKSEIVGIRDFGSDEIRRAVFWDYEKLLEDCYGLKSGAEDLDEERKQEIRELRECYQEILQEIRSGS